MARRPDGLSAYDSVVRSAGTASPWWEWDAGTTAVHRPDFPLLGELLSIPVGRGEQSESGVFARGIDAWVAAELRRAGFGANDVWPRATQPRVVSDDLVRAVGLLPARLRAEVWERVTAMPSVTPTDARVLGKAYEKQVDVVVSRWDRGPEVLISTKAQTSSFGKNLANRFEEAYGDAGNLRGRHPLAAVGFLFVQRSTVVTAEPDAFERTVDMMRKLRDDGAGNGYTATGLVLVEWDGKGPVVVREDLVPADVAAGPFFEAVIGRVLSATPVAHHVRVRELRERRDIPVADVDAAVRPTDQ